mgnify:FL=1
MTPYLHHRVSSTPRSTMTLTHPCPSLPPSHTHSVPSPPAPLRPYCSPPPSLAPPLPHSVPSVQSGENEDASARADYRWTRKRSRIPRQRIHRTGEACGRCNRLRERGISSSSGGKVGVKATSRGDVLLDFFLPINSLSTTSSVQATLAECRARPRRRRTAVGAEVEGTGGVASVVV